MSDNQQGVLWLVVHVTLGVIVWMYPLAIAVWLAFVVLASVLYAVIDRNHAGSLHIAAAYLCSYEVLARMSDGPLPWEIGRYVGIPLLLAGLATGKKLSTLIPGLIILVLITPSLVRTDFSRDIRDTLVFNWAGIFTLALAVLYFNRRVMLEREVVWILRAIAAPAVAVALASTVKSPDLDEIEFALSANRATTGFGSNQVATVLSMGLVALAVGFFMNRPLFGSPPIDLALMIYLFFRALISFSRGGLLSAVIAIGAALAVIVWAQLTRQELGQTVSLTRLLLVALIVPALGAVIMVTDQLTGGMLALRYRGETMGTLAGDRDLTLAVVTSGRSEIIRTDLEMWSEHRFLGVGPGNSARMRPRYGFRELPPHTEYSRLLAEHGLLGLLCSCVIVLAPLVIVLNPRTPVAGRVLMVAFALFSLTVMAHSATRLFGTTYIYGIGWALVIPRDLLVRLAASHPLVRDRLAGMSKHTQAKERLPEET